MKQCSTCKTSRPLSEFNKNASYADGLQKVCRLCTVEANRQYREKNKEVINAKQRERREKAPPLTEEQKAERSRKFKEWAAANDRTEYHRQYRKNKGGNLVESKREKRQHDLSGIVDGSRIPIPRGVCDSP